MLLEKNNPPPHIEAVFETLAALYPNAQTQLQYGNAFQLLIAVMLSAQTTDKAVNSATAEFFKIVQEPKDLVKFSIPELEQVFRRIGLYRTKARNAYHIAQILMEKHEGQVPLDQMALRALPGVGQKTAHVVLNTLLNAPLIAVDTHVFRVSRRLGIADAQTREQVSVQLNARVPQRFRVLAHHYLIAHGRAICQARQPSCLTCPLVKLCPWPRDKD